MRLGGFSGLLGTNTAQLSVGARLSDGLERGEGLLLFCNFTVLNDRLHLLDRHNWSLQLCGQLALLGSSLTLAQLLLFVNREQNQFALVLLQALDVLLPRLDRLVLATGVDRDANGARKAGGQTSTLERRQKLNKRDQRVK